jgi:5-methylcytosine-specific restriction endonuclease McrA
MQNEHLAHPIGSRPLDKDKKGKIIDTSKMYGNRSMPAGRIWSGTITIGLIKELLDAAKFVVSKQYQREKLNNRSWQRAVVKSAMMQDVSSCIALRRCTNGTYEILDGLQRLAALMAFFEGTITTPSNGDNGFTVHCMNIPLYVPANVTYETLKKEHKELWYGKKIDDETNEIGLECMMMNHIYAVQIYDETHSDDEASEKFCVLNDSESLRDQEKRNGISGLVSNWVRTLSRDSEKGQMYPFKDGVMKMKSNNRMNKDELLAKSLTYERHHQKLENGIYNKTMDKTSVEDLYKSNEYRKNAPNLKKLTDEVVRRWNVVDTINTGAGTRMWTGDSSRSLTMFQITYWLEEKYGTNYRMDADVFGPLLIDALNDLVDKNNSKYKTNNRKTRFSELCGLYTPGELKEKRGMLFDALDIFSDIGIESRDPDRFFSKEYKYKKLVTQWSPLKKKKVHFECALSGKEITEDNSAADHIHPHDFTGETALKNLQVLAKDVNARKGTMSNDEYLDKYRDMHLKELADAAEAQKNEYMHKVKKNEYVHKAETYEYAV